MKIYLAGTPGAHRESVFQAQPFKEIRRLVSYGQLGDLKQVLNKWEVKRNDRDRG